MDEAPPTTTGYIILGLLTSRDWSAYELAEHVGRGVDDLWSRADRQRYNAPKRLAERGLVTARSEATGRRTRTMYTITPAGRAALREWLSKPSPAPLAMEFEGMIRVLVAEQGTIEDLRGTLMAIHAQAEETVERFSALATIILESGGTFPEREHLFALVNQFMIGHAEHIAEWATWALEHTSAWGDTRSPAQDDADRSREILQAVAAKSTRGGRS